MPTYEYACGACGHEFEEFQPITARPLRQCPSCRQRKLERLIGTGAGILFKGNGFYETDYRSESYKKAAEAEKKAATGESTDSKGNKSSGKEKGGGSDTASSSSGSEKTTKNSAKGSGSSTRTG